MQRKATTPPSDRSSMNNGSAAVIVIVAPGTVENETLILSKDHGQTNREPKKQKTRSILP